MKPAPGNAPAVYRFTFDNRIPLINAEIFLHRAMVAVEGLLGKASVRLDASYYVDAPRRVLIVDATTEVGAALVRVYTALLMHEYGETALNVRRVEPANQTASNQEAV